MFKMSTYDKFLEFTGIDDNHVLIRLSAIEAVEEIKNKEDISVYLHTKETHIPIKNSYDEVWKKIGGEE